MPAPGHTPQQDANLSIDLPPEKPDTMPGTVPERVSEERAEALVGRRIGNLIITSVIGSGGMGVVCRAEHAALRTPYAVKILDPQFNEDEVWTERFRREAVACSQLRHPNIVFVTDFGFQEDVGIYIIMEHLEGETLSKVIENRPRLQLGRAIHIARQVAEALDAAHARDVIHRDLKPDNIMLIRRGDDRSHVKVLDFGIARVQTGDSKQGQRLTQAGMVMGTPHYMAPEQVKDQRAHTGPGADIYSLGVILYEMVAGVRPFDAKSNFHVMMAQLSQTAKPISDHRPDLKGTKLEGCIEVLLQKEARLRPNAMSDVIALLDIARDELLHIEHPEAVYGQRKRTLTGENERPNSGLYTAGAVRITQVVVSVREETAQSPLAALIAASPGLARLDESLFLMALWGALQRELLDRPIGSAGFVFAQRQLGWLVSLALAARDENAEKNPVDALFKSLGDLFELADRDRQEAILRAIHHLISHHRFPAECLPTWAIPTAQGTWTAIKSVMTADIRDVGRVLRSRRKKGEPTEP